MTRVHNARYLLAKEDSCDRNGCDNAANISQEACHDGVASLADSYAAEVNGQDVEGRVGCSLEDT